MQVVLSMDGVQRMNIDALTVIRIVGPCGNPDLKKLHLSESGTHRHVDLAFASSSEMKRR